MEVFNPLKLKIKSGYLRLGKLKAIRISLLRIFIDQWPAGIG